MSDIQVPLSIWYTLKTLSALYCILKILVRLNSTSVLSHALISSYGGGWGNAYIDPCTKKLSKFANSLLKKTRQDSSFLPYNYATLTCLLQYFLEQQRGKWSEQTVGKHPSIMLVVGKG